MAAVVAVAAVPAGATTTFRSRLRAIAGALLIAGSGGAASGCHREKHTEPIEPRAAAPTEIPAPRGLLGNGTLGPLSDTWRRLHSALEGRGRLLPSTPELAVTTLAGFSPLVAGLVDADAPVPFAIVATDPADVGLVLAVRLTSAAELTAAVTSGADAKFISEVDVARGTTLFLPKGASGQVTVGVAGQCLVFAKSREHFREAAAHVAKALGPGVSQGDLFDVVAEGRELSGPVKALALQYGEQARRLLEAADAESRAEHGGRSPDFGDTRPVIDAIGSITEAVAAFMSSTTRARIRATLLEPAPIVRLELEPAETGTSRSISNTLPRGDLSVLLSLPAWTDAAFTWRRGSGDRSESSLVDPVTKVFGDRMTESDRARLKRWADDADRGFGRTAAVGLYGGQSGAGAFLVSSDGDGAALRRATAELVDILRIRAIAGPVTALAGRVRASANGASLGGMPVTRLSIETERGTNAQSKYRAACAAAGGRAALVLGSDDIDVRLSELLGGQAGPKLASDRILSDAAKRIGKDAAGAVAARFRTSSAPTFATAILGSNGSSVSVEIEGAVPVFEALLAGAPRSSAGP